VLWLTWTKLWYTVHSRYTPTHTCCLYMCHCWLLYLYCVFSVLCVCIVCVCVFICLAEWVILYECGKVVFGYKCLTCVYIVCGAVHVYIWMYPCISVWCIHTPVLCAVLKCKWQLSRYKWTLDTGGSWGTILE